MNLKKSLLVIFVVTVFSCYVAAQVSAQPASASEDQYPAAVESPSSVFSENDTSYFPSSSDDESLPAGTGRRNRSLTGFLVQTVLVLALVAAAIYGIMRFFKKRNSGLNTDDDFLRHVSSLSIGPGRSVEIVTLLDNAYVLGVSDSSVNLIEKLDDKELVTAMNLNFDKKQTSRKPMNFGDVLEMLMPTRKKGSVYSSTEKGRQEKE